MKSEFDEMVASHVAPESAKFVRAVLAICHRHTEHRINAALAAIYCNRLREIMSSDEAIVATAARFRLSETTVRKSIGRQGGWQEVNDARDEIEALHEICSDLFDTFDPS